MRYALVIMALLTLFGCGNANEASPNQGQDGQKVRVKQTVPPKKEIKDAESVAQRLESIAEQVPDVNSANCVVFGDTAIVGINVNQDLERSRVGTVKYSVAEALRKDPYGVHAVVTADIDINGRLKELRDEIRKGRPIAGFAEEMADIMGRIIPQMPKNVSPSPGNVEQRKEDQQKLNQKSM
ncbi:YhcN/YlaJ family sporulation lipoprotein [Marinicrinis lubricantis]|uniref:YhcN/YlaJ family sporulation lipoprotein n=1 Tax=Marinicrinis lubricantis TaxID=2086470 RepID=A0ABW1IUN6_9BACL